MKSKRQCLFCESEFIPKHGNQQYCSSPCKKAKKAATQEKLYGLLKEFRRGYLGNFKLFEQLLPSPGKKTYALHELNTYGFKHNCYFGTVIDRDRNTWYKVGNYCFTIFKKDDILSIIVINQ